MQSVLLFLALVAGARASAMEDAFSSNRNEEAERRLTDTPDYDEETCDGVDLHRYDSLEDCCRSVVDHQHELTFFLKTLDTETMAPVCEAKGFTRNGTAPAPVPPTSVPLPAPTSVPVPGPAPVPLPAPTSLPLPAPTRPAPTSVPLPPPTSVPRPAPTSVPLPYPTNVPTRGIPDQPNLKACYSFTGGDMNPSHIASPLTGYNDCDGSSQLGSCANIPGAAPLPTPIAGGGPDGSDHLLFDGSSEVLFDSALTQGLSSNQPRTICVWAKFDKDSQTDQSLFSYGESTGNGSPAIAGDFGLRTRDDPSKFHVQIQQADPAPFDILAYSPNAWHHYCLVHRTFTELYVDGSKIELYNNDGSPWESTYRLLQTTGFSSLRLGNWLDNTPPPGTRNNHFFKGAMDELCVWKSALSPSDVLAVRALAQPAYPEPPADFPAAASLAACYHFDTGDASPTFVSNNACAPDITKCEGTVSGATSVPGLDNGNALYFDGTKEVVFPKALTQNILGNKPRSVAFWARFDIAVQPSGEGSFFSHGIAETRKDFGFRTRPDSGSNKFHVQIFGDDPDPFDITGYDPNAQNVWHHYCLTYDGDQVKLYFDGDEVLLSVHNPSDLETTSDPFRLGNWIDSDTSNHYFKGAIDDLCVYESALSQAYIDELRGLVMSAAPTAGPTFQPTNVPTHGPTFEPTAWPTSSPTSSSPTVTPAPTPLPLPVPTSSCPEVGIIDDNPPVPPPTPGGIPCPPLCPPPPGTIINENDCKVWNVTVLLTSLTVTSLSAAAEVEGVDVTFAPGGGLTGVFSFLAVGEDGNARATTIAAEGDIDSGVRVAVRNSELGTATGTSIIVQGAIGSALVPGEATLASVLVGSGLGSNADDTNIVADVMDSSVYVGYNQGTATNTTINADSVSNVYVGRVGGTATNTNIACTNTNNLFVGRGGTAIDTTINVDSVTGNVEVGSQSGSGTAINTHITIGAGGFTSGGKIVVWSDATNTKVFNHGSIPFVIYTFMSASSTTCNGSPLTIPAAGYPPGIPPVNWACNPSP